LYRRRNLALDPNFARAHAVLGQSLHHSGLSEEAIEPLTAAIRLDPYDLYLHFLAQAYFGLQQYEEAAALLKRRILRKPDTDLSRVLLAACYGFLGRAEDARALWEEALPINPPAATTVQSCLADLPPAMPYCVVVPTAVLRPITLLIRRPVACATARFGRGQN
jgi:tetratricopeptide (TPR) repeat protein